MTCIVENLFVDGDVAILEWRDPLGLRGIGVFQIRDGKISAQRGYWDKLTFEPRCRTGLKRESRFGRLSSRPIE